MLGLPNTKQIDPTKAPSGVEQNHQKEENNRNGHNPLDIGDIVSSGLKNPSREHNPLPGAPNHTQKQRTNPPEDASHDQKGIPILLLLDVNTSLHAEISQHEEASSRDQNQGEERNHQLDDAEGAGFERADEEEGDHEGDCNGDEVDRPGVDYVYEGGFCVDIVEFVGTFVLLGLVSLLDGLLLLDWAAE